jgi:hypothetical protein
MNFLRLLPAIISCLLLGAHFMRMGLLPIATVCALVPPVLMLRKPWAALAVQFVLVAGSVEWVRTLIGLYAARQAAGLSGERMALILGAVAAFTLASALLFRTRALRERYGTNKRRDEIEPA